MAKSNPSLWLFLFIFKNKNIEKINNEKGINILLKYKLIGEMRNNDNTILSKNSFFP
jgi:hypothetical protein